MYLVHWVGEGLDPKGGFFDPAILTHFMASKWLKMAINVPFVAISRPGGSEMVDQRGSRLDQGRTHLGGCVGTIFGSGMAIGPSNWLKMAINGLFVAIGRSGGSKMVDQGGSRLDQGRTHLGGCVGTIYRVRNGHWGAP